MKESIRRFLNDHGPATAPREYSDSDSLLEAGVLDSVTMVDLIAFLEKSFGIHVEDDDMIPENFDSIDAVAEYVARKNSSAV